MLVHHADARRQRRMRRARRQRPQRARGVGDQHPARRRRRSGRTGCSSAWSCRRRSRRAAPGSRPGAARGRWRRWRASAPKRLVMPSRRRTTGAAASPAAGLTRSTWARCRRSRPCSSPERISASLRLHLVDHVVGHQLGVERRHRCSRRRRGCSAGRNPRPRSVPPWTASSALSIEGSMCQSALATTVPGYCVLGVDDVADRLDAALLGGVRDAEALGVEHVRTLVDHRERRFLGLGRVVPGADERDRELDVRVDLASPRP